jgi:UDP-glucuronate decarboxylase
MKKILVAGGAGFIGNHLCRFLLEKGNSVVCFDNLQSSSKENIESLLENENFTFIEGDINHLPKFSNNFDQIYNLACPASPVHYQKEPINTIRTNTVGVINLLELALKDKARILQNSTSEIYGNPLCHPQIETYCGNVNPIGPRACYDEGKRIAETLFFEYYRKHNLEIRIARVFNTYGPSMLKEDGRVVSNFIVQALQNQDITIYGSGNQTRSLCYVSDLVGGLYKLMNNEKITGPVNLGNPREMTILEIAQKIIELTNSKSKLKFMPLPADDPTKRRPDISLAKRELDWEPEIILEDGLKETIDYFKGKI